MAATQPVGVGDGDGKSYRRWVAPDFFERYPSILTFLTTYRCNAQCEQCCFESNPRIRGSLSGEEMRRYIDIAKAEFPALRLVVFTGGECFLLKDELFETVEHAARSGFNTRCVTNAFWGKSSRTAERIVARLREVGLSEVNISTGLDHQQWVPESSVVNAVRALAAAGIPTLVTVESDTPDSDCYARLVTSKALAELIGGPYLTFRCNSWMPFKATDRKRLNSGAHESVDTPCDQVFQNVVISPYGKLIACCGLTLEYIPELHLGDVRAKTFTSLAELYWSQLDDFLKLWIHLDGPYRIMKTLFGDEVEEDLEDVVHMCQACAIMHRDPNVRRKLAENYLKYVPDVMNRFLAKMSVMTAEHDFQRKRAQGGLPMSLGGGL